MLCAEGVSIFCVLWACQSALRCFGYQRLTSRALTSLAFCVLLSQSTSARRCAAPSAAGIGCTFSQLSMQGVSALHRPAASVAASRLVLLEQSAVD